MSKASQIALVAAAGLMVSAAIAPAKAADLGGGCCADLEERVAELEATTARKGNRVVSLQVYGQVNKALLFFDNGDDSDAYVVDNDHSGSRLGFTGKASIKPGWGAGYAIEFDVQDSASNLIAEDDDEGNENEILIRRNELWIDSEQFGRITLGQGSSASDGISEIILANSIVNSDTLLGSAISVLDDGTTMGNFATNLDGVSRRDRVRYDSPAIYGFTVSASWGEDDYYDVALRFKKEWNSFRVAAGIAYVDADETTGTGALGEFEQVSGSVSVMHVPTGIYGAFAAGEKDFDSDRLDSNFWYAQLGIEKRFLSYGATTVYGEYGQYTDFVNDEIDGSDADRLGFGVVQTFDSAGLDLYATAQFWDFEHDGEEGDLTVVTIGSRIKF